MNKLGDKLIICEKYSCISGQESGNKEIYYSHLKTSALTARSKYYQNNYYRSSLENSFILSFILINEFAVRWLGTSNLHRLRFLQKPFR